MKSLVFILFVTLTHVSMAIAQTSTVPNPIQELDQGSCWIQEIKDNDQSLGFKIVSFGNGIAFGLYRDEFTPAGSKLKDWIQTQLKVRFKSLPATTYEVAFHCFSSGHLISIQVQTPTQSLCLTAKGKGTNELNPLELIKIVPGEKWNPGDFCYGMEERALGLSLKVEDDASVASLRGRVAKAPALQAVIAKIDYRPGSSFAMARLKADYGFREVEAKRILEADPEFMNQIKDIWFNSYQSITGEDRVLYQGTIEGY